MAKTIAQTSAAKPINAIAVCMFITPFFIFEGRALMVPRTTKENKVPTDNDAPVKVRLHEMVDEANPSQLVELISFLQKINHD